MVVRALGVCANDWPICDFGLIVLRGNGPFGVCMCVMPLSLSQLVQKSPMVFIRDSVGRKMTRMGDDQER